MTFRPNPNRDRWDRDPLYIRNRNILKAQRRPCWRCGRPIDYTGSYWQIIRGRRRINPNAFVAGHIVDRADGGTHDLHNLAPEHAACSIRSGARAGARKANARKPRVVITRPATASRW